MQRTGLRQLHSFRKNLLIVITLGLICVGADGYGTSESQRQTETITTRTPNAVLWRAPVDVESLNLLYGAGSPELEPKEPFSFVKEITGGATRKFEVVDGGGVHWIAKIGEEAKSETAATRLLWAVGYFTDEAYYLSELHVAGMPKLEDIDVVWKGTDAVVLSVRLEPIRSERMQLGNWSWSKNPFIGTREMNGLRIMMALINNWDLKKDNNAIYSIKGQQYYVVSDLGASFGKTGGVGSRTKSSLDDYAESKFIEKADAHLVDLRIKSRPFFLLAVDPYHYNKLTSREKVGREIPRDDAKWLGEILSRLTPEQISDCFRAAGYTADEIDGFAKVVQGRIAELNRF